MNSQLPTCPYCNTLLTDSAAAGRSCPRCGETLPRSPGDDNGAGADQQPSESSKEPRPSNRRVAVAVLALMALAALGGLAFALFTWDFRERNHYRGKTSAGAERQRPADWPALGFLPDGTNLVAGIDFAELGRSPAGKQILAAPRPRLLDVALQRLESWTGLGLESLDHAVVGTGLHNEIPQLTVVVQTRLPYRMERIAQALQPARPVPYHKRPLYTFPVKPAGEAMLWCVEDRTIVLILRADAVRKRDIEAIPPAPRQGALVPGLQRVMEERLPKDAAFWTAGHLEQADLLAALLEFTPHADEGRVLKQVKSFAVGATCSDTVTVRGDFLSRDGGAAQALAAQLEKAPLAGLESRKVIAPGKDAETAGNWVLLQVRGEAEMVRRGLENPRRLFKR